MSIGKDLFMRAHQQLVDEFLEAHPLADESYAYELMADRAHDRMIDNIAAMADYAKDRAKEGK